MMSVVPMENGADGESLEKSRIATYAQVVRRHKLETRKLKREHEILLHGVKGGKGGNKKLRAELVGKIEQEVAELEKRHEQELAGLPREDLLPDDDDLAPKKEPEIQQKPSRAQKRRLAKIEAEKAALQREAEKLSLGPMAGEVEENRIKERLKEFGLDVRQVKPNGDCMYSAIALQIGKTVEDVRGIAANYIENNPESFAPFIFDESLESHITGIRKNEWGGEVEIRAISNALELHFRVISASSEPLEIHPQGKEEVKTAFVTLTFHKDAFALGDHYNAAVPIAENKESDGFRTDGATNP